MTIITIILLDYYYVCTSYHYFLLVSRFILFILKTLFFVGPLEQASATTLPSVGGRLRILVPYAVLAVGSGASQQPEPAAGREIQVPITPLSMM